MLDNRHTALHPLPGVGHRLLKGPLGDAQPLDTDLEPGLIHHGKHAGKAVIFLAQHVTDSPFVVAKGQHTGGAAVNPQFVLAGHRVNIVALAECAIGIYQVLGNDEQRNTATALGRPGQLGQHQVHDIVGGLVVTPGNKYFLPVNAVVIAIRHGPGFHHAQV